MEGIEGRMTVAFRFQVVLFIRGHDMWRVKMRSRDVWGCSLDYGEF